MKSPAGATFQYKCRRCDKTFDLWGYNNEQFAFKELSLLVASTNREKMANRTCEIVMLSQHRCEDGGMGVADLQGYQLGTNV